MTVNPMQRPEVKAKAAATRARNQELRRQQLEAEQEVLSTQEKLFAAFAPKAAELVRDRLLELQPRIRAHQLGLAALSGVLTGERLLSEHEIVQSSTPASRLCGVYFLIEKGRIVYVGQSVNVTSRVASHHGIKAFDAFAYVPCEPNQLDVLESLYIHYLQPTLNSGVTLAKDGVKAAPLNLQDLLRRAAA